MPESKIIPVKCNLDLAPEYIDAQTARFIKGLTPFAGTIDGAGNVLEGENEIKLKPNQSNELYVNITLPAGDNFAVGGKGFPETNEVYVPVWNSNGNHFWYRLNCSTRTFDIIKIDPCFNFQLKPEHFINTTSCWLEVIILVDPETEEKLIKKDLYWTDGFNYQGYLRTDDCIQTNGFDELQFPYFAGNYDRCNALRMGLPTPKDCIKIEEIAIPETYEDIHTAAVLVNSLAPNTIILSSAFGVLPQYSEILAITNAGVLNGNYSVITATIAGTYYKITVQENVPMNNSGIIGTVTLRRRVNNDGAKNNLLFNTWQFRIEETDVWGRVSEWGIISDMYVPGINDCISIGSNLPSCLNLIFSAGTPFTNSISIAWRNCNNEQWKKETTLFLYKGSNIGKWWLRQRNPDIIYDQVTNKITYKFCRDKECDPIDVNETNRLQNPLPKTSQSLFKLTNKIALANNKDGFNPISQDQLDKIKFTVTPPGASNPDTRTITIYVAIDDMHQQVFHINNRFYYGGQPSGGGGINVQLCVQKKQQFKNTEQSGFCGYLVNGTSTISTQVYIDSANNLIDDPTWEGYSKSPTKRTLQKFVFYNVQKGSYIFSIASANSDPANESNFRETSAPIFGLCPFDKNNNYSLDLSLTGRQKYKSCELYIDCCAGDYDTMNDNKMLVLANFSFPFSYAQSGYISQSAVDNTRWELLRVQQGGQTSSYLVSSLITDRNGFYWIYQLGGATSTSLIFILYAYSNCMRIGKGIGITASNQELIQQDYTMEGFFTGMVGETYTQAICNTIQIKGRVLLSGTSIGVPNMVVSLTRGGQAVTDDDGFFTLICHDDASQINITNGDRKDKLILNSGACSYDSLSGGCLPVFDISITPCGNCQERTQSIGLTEVIYKVERGLLSGGTYLPRANFYDWLGRKTFSQQLKPLQIPSIIQSQAIGASVVTANIDPTFITPLEFKYFTISLTEETTIDKYISWIVDRVEFIDNTNKINNIAPTLIKIYYQSVTKFASINGFNVTTAWQIIAQGEDNPAISDKVQFFLNGDGKFFTKNITSLVKYSKDGIYFTIDYTSELKDLKQNALMRLFRPKECTGTELDFEICSTIDLIKGVPQTLQFILNAFDTYYLSRQIPVPAPVAPTPTVTQIATTDGNVTTYEDVPIVSPVIENRNLGYRFESDSPSNFWGKGCKNIGRPNSKNPYECELVHPYQIALSGTLSVNGQLNYLCYFDKDKKTDLQILNSGGIVAGFADIGRVFFLTKIRCFSVGFNDNIGRINNDGTFQAGSIKDEFGLPNAIDLYGCDYKDKMSIQFRNGLIMWVDRNRAEAVQSDFGSVKSFTKDKCNGWMKAKVKQVLADELAYFTGAITPANEYLITNQTLAGDAMNYINSERTYSPLIPETVSFNISTRDLIQWFGFTYENYAWLDGDILNNQMFSFMKGVPYSHYNGKQTGSFNVFHGVETEKVLDIVYHGQDVTKKKMFFTITNWCENQLFFADNITTEAKQLSRLLLEHWRKGAYLSVGAFLTDLNTIADPNIPIATGANKLMDGDHLYGCWIRIRLVGDISKNSKYCEVLGIEVLDSNYEKS